MNDIQTLFHQGIMQLTVANTICKVVEFADLYISCTLRCHDSFVVALILVFQHGMCMANTEGP